MAQVLSRAVRGEVRQRVAAFRLHPRELQFAQAVLTLHTRLWLWRTNQRAFSGDFLLVDMSSPNPQRRPVWVVDLKLYAPLRRGGGGASNQLVNHPLAVRALQRVGVVGPQTAPQLLTGGNEAVLAEIVGRSSTRV